MAAGLDYACRPQSLLYVRPVAHDLDMSVTLGPRRMALLQLIKKSYTGLCILQSFDEPGDEFNLSRLLNRLGSGSGFGNIVLDR